MKPSEIAVLVCVLGVLGAIAVAVGGLTSDGARNTVDASNIRQIGQASLIYANDNQENLPPRFGLNEDGLWEKERASEVTPGIHALAAALAREGGLNDTAIWVSATDESKIVRKDMSVVLRGSGTDRRLNSAFRKSGVSFQYVAGLTTAVPSTTPVAVTRGLDVDGHWVASREESVYGSAGGHIVFMGGNVRYQGRATNDTWWERWRGRNQPPGKAAEFVDTQGDSTHDILETITDQQAIYSFPETPTGKREGLPGIGKPWPKPVGGGHTR